MNEYMRGQQDFKRRVVDVLGDFPTAKAIVSKMPLHGDAHLPDARRDPVIDAQLERARRIVEKNEPKGPKHVGDIFLGGAS